MMEVLRKSYLAGNTWATNRCGEDVNLDAGDSVTGIVGSSALLREIREQSSNQPMKDGTNTFKITRISGYIQIMCFYPVSA